MIIQPERLPQLGESLAQYMRRVRSELGLSQAEMSQRAGVHIQSIGKIESGKTNRLNSKTKAGLAKVLGVPEDYLEAVCRGIPVTQVQTLKICPQCWKPGTDAEAMWLELRSKYCFACGMPLRDRCVHCHEPIQSLKFKFCPFCGQSYKDKANPVS